MIFISHRGNLAGPNPGRENSPDYIDEAINAGHIVEVDVRRVGCSLFLGHDYAQYKVQPEWIEERKKSLLIHLKDFSVAKTVADCWHTFCHVSDPFTLTSEGRLWLHDLSLQPDLNTIVPLMSKELIASYGYRTVYAICSDYEVTQEGNLKT